MGQFACKMDGLGQEMMNLLIIYDHLEIDGLLILGNLWVGSDFSNLSMEFYGCVVGRFPHDKRLISSFRWNCPAAWHRLKSISSIFQLLTSRDWHPFGWKKKKCCEEHLSRGASILVEVSCIRCISDRRSQTKWSSGLKKTFFWFETARFLFVFLSAGSMTPLGRTWPKTAKKNRIMNSQCQGNPVIVRIG